MIRKLLIGIVASIVAISFFSSGAFPAAAQTTAPTSFTKNLTVGSTGNQVLELQQFLISNGFSTKATGYFGAMTKAALAVYQKSKSIIPAVGYFGPMTRQTVSVQLAADAIPTPVLPVTPIPAPSQDSSGTSTSGVVTVTLAGTPPNSPSIQTAIDAPVYGLNFQVSLAPVTLNRFDVQVQDYQGDTIGTAAENPGSFITNIKLWNDQTLIGTWNTSSGTPFVQSSSDSTLYYVRLSGINYILPAGTSTDLTVTFSTTGTLDVDHTLVLEGYTGEPGTNIQVTSGGTAGYYGADGSQFKRTQVFKSRIMPIVSLAADPANTPGYGNYVVDANNGLIGADMSIVNVKVDDGDAFITDVTANVTASGTAPINISLYDTAISTSSPVASAAPTGLSGGPFGSDTTGSISFHNLHLPVQANTILPLDFQADIPGGIVEGSSVSVGDSNMSITYQTDFGASETVTNSAVGTYPSYFYSAAPTFTLVSATASATSHNSSGETEGIGATFVLTFQPENSDMDIINPADITVDASSDGGVTFTNIPNVAVDVTPTPSSTYARGGTYTITITGTASNTDLPSTGTYVFYLDGLNWTMANGVAVNPNYFFGNLGYYTNGVVFVK